MKYTLVLALASAVSASVFQAHNVESFGASLSDVVAGDADIYGGFEKADVLNIYDDDVVARRARLGRGGSRRQAVPDDATPDPNRNITTPENIFVLQCDLAGFRGDCLVFGAAPGKCGMCCSFLFSLPMSLSLLISPLLGSWCVFLGLVERLGREQQGV